MSVDSVERLRQENNKRIILTTKHLLNENNPTNLTLGQIAAGAGISVKTINNIFGTKTILLLQTVIRAYTEVHNMLDALVDSPTFATQSGLEQVMTLHYERARFQQRNPYIFRSISEIERLPMKTDKERELCEEYLTMADRLTGYYIAPLQKGHADGSIKQDIDADELYCILFFSFGAITQKLQSISLNAAMAKHINSLETLHTILSKTKEYLNGAPVTPSEETNRKGDYHE